jgi:hypothetical protein
MVLYYLVYTLSKSPSSKSPSGASSVLSQYSSKIIEKLARPESPVLGDYEDAQQVSPDSNKALFEPEPGILARFSELISPKYMPEYSKLNLDFKLRDFKSWLKDFDARNPSMTLSQLYALRPLDIQKLPEDDRQVVCNLIRVVSEVSPNVLLDHYGDKMLLFLYAHYPTDNKTKQRLESALQQITSFSDVDSIKRALVSRRGSNFLKSLIQAYKLHSSAGVDVISQALPVLLDRHYLGKGQVDYGKFSVETLSPACLLKRSKKRGKPSEYFGHIINGKYFSFYLDAPFSLVLKFEDEPVAVVSCNISRNGKTMEIRQLQAISPYEVINGSPYYKDETGQKHFHKRLRPRGIFEGRKLRYNFKELLVDLAELWAQLNNFKEVMILSGSNNFHIIKRKDEEEPRLEEDRARKIYDATASKLGYQESSSGNWYKSLVL